MGHEMRGRRIRSRSHLHEHGSLDRTNGSELACLRPVRGHVRGAFGASHAMKYSVASECAFWSEAEIRWRTRTARKEVWEFVSMTETARAPFWCPARSTCCPARSTCCPARSGRLQRALCHTYSSILIAGSTYWPPMGTVTTARPFSVAAGAHPPANAIATCPSSASEPNVQDGPLFPAAAASAMGTPAFSSGSELQDRSNGLHPHIVNGLALAHCSTSRHHHVCIGAVKRSHVRLSCIRAAQVRALDVRSSSSSSSSSSKAATQTVRSEDRTTAAADEHASSC
jgi:hypothetical protein